MKRKGKLNFEDRVKLEVYINDGLKATEISKKLKCSKQAIYREIQRNTVKQKRVSFNGNKCTLMKNCPIGYERTKFCSKQCKYFQQYECPRLQKFPFTCNGCHNKNCCKSSITIFYNSNHAQNLATKRLKETRMGIRISQEDFEQINEIVSPLVKDKKQSLRHILATHTEIDVDERTLRNWIDKGYMDAKPIDLPRKVAFKPKKEYIHRITKPTAIILGRSYRDYREFIKENPELLTCQIDTLEGKKTDINKVLTIHFPSIHFQYGVLIKNINQQKVNDYFINIRENIGINMWKKIFPIILTDNGIEFNDLYQIENEHENGEHITNVFYCNPYCSSQKGACEKNHEFFRYIEPKYTSLDHLTQEKINLIFSNINSVFRTSLNGVRPIDLAEIVLGKEFLQIIGIKKIEPDEVNLTQSLTKKIKHN